MGDTRCEDAAGAWAAFSVSPPPGPAPEHAGSAMPLGTSPGFTSAGCSILAELLGSGQQGQLSAVTGRESLPPSLLLPPPPSPRRRRQQGGAWGWGVSVPTCPPDLQRVWTSLPPHHITQLRRCPCLLLSRSPCHGANGPGGCGCPSAFMCRMLRAACQRLPFQNADRRIPYPVFQQQKASLVFHNQLEATEQDTVPVSQRMLNQHLCPARTPDHGCAGVFPADGELPSKGQAGAL